MNELGIDTTGWLQGCGIPGCRWRLDPDHPECPEHSDRPTIIADPDDPEDVARVKKLALNEDGARRAPK